MMATVADGTTKDSYNADELLDEKNGYDPTENNALQEFEIKCEGLCQRKYPPDKLYRCQHKKCTTDKRCLCSTCASLHHQFIKNNSHAFDKKSLLEILSPDPKHVEKGKILHEKLTQQIAKMKEFIWVQKWHGAEATAMLSVSFGSSIGATIYSCSSRIGSQCVSTITATAPYGAGLAVALECCYIWYRYHKKEISGYEAIALGSAALVATSTSTMAALTLSSYTDTLIATNALGPIGAIGVTIIGAIIVGALARSFVDDTWRKWFGEDNDKQTRRRIGKEAVQFFFGNVNYDKFINDETKFNENTLRRRYRELSLVCHPDRKDGNKEEWLKLCSHYGILTAIYENKFQQQEPTQNHTATNDPQSIQ